MPDRALPFLPEDKPADRPLQCGECRRPVRVLYTEVSQAGITRTEMCAECPCLYQKLHGGGAKQKQESLGGGAGLSCGICGTTLEAVRTGALLGCSECYEVFSEVIFNELVQSGALPSRFVSIKKSMPMHLGRTVGKGQEMSPSLKLLALDEALKETLAKEDYEQAALLRDQIKALTEEQSEGK